MTSNDDSSDTLNGHANGSSSNSDTTQSSDTTTNGSTNSASANPSANPSAASAVGNGNDTSSTDNNPTEKSSSSTDNNEAKTNDTQSPSAEKPGEKEDNNNSAATGTDKTTEKTDPDNNSNSNTPQKATNPGTNSEIDKVIIKLTTLKKNTCSDLKVSEIEKICRECRSQFESECALLRVDAPMKIVGDIHGQYFDLLRLFELGGFPNGADGRYIFLGDYVDRGNFSLEVIILLFCYKIKFRMGFFLLRGNHECGSINRIYGFFDECKRRYKQDGVRLWKTFTDAFNFLPVAGIIDEKIFCMHGGISPYMMKKNSLNHIANLKRPTDVPDRGLLCDLLWADPDPYIDTWGPNDRGVSYVFGANVLNQFLNVHDLDLLCRAHQVVEDGYEFFGNRTLVTIFSAPNYCGEFDNAGAMMSVDDTLMCSFHVLKPNYKRRTRFYQ